MLEETLSGVSVRTPLEQYRITSGLTYGRLAKALGLSYYVARRVCKGERMPTAPELERMVKLGGAQLSAKAWKDFVAFKTDEVRRYSYRRNTPPQFPLPTKAALDASALFSIIYDDTNFRKQRQMISLPVDQIAFLDYLCGISGRSRSSVVRRLISYAKNVLSEAGTTMLPVPEGLSDDYFIEPDSPEDGSPLITVGSDEWAAKCAADLEIFEEEQKHKDEDVPSPEEVVDGDMFSEVELLKIQASALAGKSEKPAGWKPRKTRRWLNNGS